MLHSKQISGMLLLCAGIAEHGVVAAVSRRFTGAEITAALAFLQQQGLVNSSGVKRPLMLSKLFAEHLEVCLRCFYPATVPLLYLPLGVLLCL